MKNIIKKIISGFAILLFVVGIITGGVTFCHIIKFYNLASPVDAKEYEDETESEYEYEKEYTDENNGSSSSQTVKTKSVPIYKTVLVQKIITTLDPIFTTDQDGDSLVDGLDPHPTVPEREYFTDDDDDGVSNAFDMYQDEDDFAYYEEENDDNGDGILDSYEFMGER